MIVPNYLSEINLDLYTHATTNTTIRKFEVRQANLFMWMLGYKFLLFMYRICA